MKGERKRERERESKRERGGEGGEKEERETTLIHFLVKCIETKQKPEQDKYLEFVVDVPVIQFLVEDEKHLICNHMIRIIIILSINDRK